MYECEELLGWVFWFILKLTIRCKSSSRRWLCRVYTKRVYRQWTELWTKTTWYAVGVHEVSTAYRIAYDSMRSRYTLGRESFYCWLTRQRLSTLSLECQFADSVDFWESIMKIVDRKNGFESSSCESSTECVYTYFSAANSVYTVCEKFGHVRAQVHTYKVRQCNFHSVRTYMISHKTCVFTSHPRRKQCVLRQECVPLPVVRVP